MLAQEPQIGQNLWRLFLHGSVYAHPYDGKVQGAQKAGASPNGNQVSFMTNWESDRKYWISHIYSEPKGLVLPQYFYSSTCFYAGIPMPLTSKPSLIGDSQVSRPGN